MSIQYVHEYPRVYQVHCSIHLLYGEFFVCASTAPKQRVDISL